MDATQAEFSGFPVIEERVKVKSPLRQYIDATAEHGPLVPPPMIAAALELHRSRVYQLIEEGRLPTIDVAGHRWVPASALELFWTEERKTGRPCKQPKFSKLLRAAFEK
jgi:hypothetical protein